MKYIVYTLKNIKTPIYDTFRRMETQNAYDISSCLMPANGRGYKQLGTSWTLSYQPSRKLASESDARPTT